MTFLAAAGRAGSPVISLSMNQPGFRERRQNALERMAEAGVDALIATHLPDARYLTGFTGSNAVVVLTARGATLFTDGRYTVQAREEARGVRVVIAKKSALLEACAALAAQPVERCGFDSDHTTITMLDAMRRAVPVARRR